MAAAKTKKSGKAGEKNSLVKNINKKKKAGTSNPRSKFTVSEKAYSDMENNWSKSGKKK